ncbi:VOC family protein [Actinomycetospora termitidis]|uniref:VOC family protein n=1 Tax=Actinomycetospora termitidis TaxID=3053470 RepID=A0ABT7M9W6_9PSEU|nr:VOC family protein [Actinomycetospora sp. Odt1-22]MDL5156208.1 VOC family protein [Actinomycetospora sp. Odt1-22]
MARLLSHLLSLEITSPDVESSVAFYVERFGLRVIDRADGKVHLRCWGDHYRHSLVVSPGPDAGLATMTWRTDSAEALDEAVARVEAAGVTGEWREDPPAQGRTYTFVGPFGHRMGLVWDVPPFEAEDGYTSVYPDRPERRSSHAAAPRFLDHVTIAASDVRGFAQWYSEVLGFRVMAFTDLEDAPVTVFSVLTTNEKSHDLGIVVDTSATAGRVHHIAFWADHPEDLVRTADLLLEHGTPIEYGPSVHGIGEQHFLYFREPSSLRVELNSGGYRNYVPDWRARTWRPSEGSNDFFRNWHMPDSMMEAFPAATGMAGTEDGVSPQLHEELTNPWAARAPEVEPS